MPTSAHSFSRTHHDAIVPGQPVAAERRLKCRYPLNLSVRFRPLAGSRFSGAGRAINLSSSGLFVVSHHIVSQHELSVGARVEMSIEWPSLLDGRIPLQLFAVGRVVRSRATNFAAEFEGYQFRTMRNSGLPHARVGGDVVQWPG